MNPALLAIASITTVLTVGLVFVLFVWAARKDGEYDRSVQRRLGILRRSSL